MSSLISKIEKLFGSAEKYVIALGKTELKVAMDSTLGQAISSAIKAGEAGTTSVEKLELGLASLLPTLKTYIADPSALETDLETVGKAMIESALTYVKETGPEAILKALAAAI